MEANSKPVPSLDDTFATFFADWTEQDAARMQEEYRQDLAQIDAALASDDWRTLARLQVAHVIDDGLDDLDHAINRRWVLHQEQIDQMRRDLELTPAQLAARHNASADW